MSPKGRGRPPGRGPSRKGAGRSASGRGPTGRVRAPGTVSAWPDEELTDCWFDEPFPGDRRSWAVPQGHGTYQGLELERLDPEDEDERTLLLQAQHLDYAEALEREEEVIVGGEPMSPRLHVTLHQVVASQLMADDPPETWQTVRRLAGLGYDWHNIMHMISALVAENLHQAMTERQPFDREDYARRLDALPGDWPPPEELGLR